MAVTTPRRHLLSTRATEGRAWVAAGVLLAAALVLAGAVTWVLHVDPRRSAAVRDVAAIAYAQDDLPYYASWSNYTGVLAWTAAATACLLTARLVVRADRRRAGLLAGAGGVVLLMAVDDLYMLHDGFFVQRGVDEQVVMGGIAGLGLVWAVVFARDLLADPQTPLLLVAVGLLLHSAVSDVVGDLLLHEESTKLAAALAWAVWGYRVCVRDAVRAAEVPAVPAVPAR